MTTEGIQKARPFPWRLGLFAAFGFAAGALMGTVTARGIVALDAGAARLAAGERLALAADLVAVYGLLGLLAGIVAAGLRYAALHLLRRRPAAGTGWPRWSRWLLAAMALAVVGFGLATVFGGRHPPPEARELAALPEKPEKDSRPVVVLLIDGADLDDVILPMVEVGKLPTFRRLIDRGTWGPLATRRPTLSPRLWTTIATGKTPREHGVEDFVYFRFPGVHQPVDRLPRSSGLRHHLFPLLERAPGLGFRRVPYTSDLRRRRALWEIVGDYYPVGVYRWLITWPAEAVEGFMVSGGVYAGPGGWHPLARGWVQSLKKRSPDALEALGQYPPDLEVPAPERRLLGRPADYLEHGVDLDEKKYPRLRFIRRSLRDQTIYELPALMEAYRPKLTMAAFYTVDSHQHLFARDRRDGGVFAGAVAERYRFTDRMLGRFLKTLPPDSNLLVISDHGYDFELDHHWDAPAGLFLAHGPAFAANRRVEGLTILDVAPLCLYLLGLPVAEDLPGAAAGTFGEAIRPKLWRQRPPATIPTWERGPRRSQAVDVSFDEELRESLEALGYLQ